MRDPLRRTYRIIIEGDETYRVQERVPFLIFFGKWKQHDRSFITLERARDYVRNHFMSLSDENKEKEKCEIEKIRMMG